MGEELSLLSKDINVFFFKRQRQRGFFFIGYFFVESR